MRWYDAMRCDNRGTRLRLQGNSQIVEREELCDTAKDHEYGNSEVHHATMRRQSLITQASALPLRKLLPSSTHKISEKSMAESLRCGNRSLATGNRGTKQRMRWVGYGRGHLFTVMLLLRIATRDKSSRGQRAPRQELVPIDKNVILHVLASPLLYLHIFLGLWSTFHPIAHEVDRTECELFVCHRAVRSSHVDWSWSPT